MILLNMVDAGFSHSSVLTHVEIKPNVRTSLILNVVFNVGCRLKSISIIEFEFGV